MQRNGQPNSLVPRRQQEDLSRWDEGEWFNPQKFFNASPWEMMRRMREDMDHMMGQFFGPSMLTGWGGESSRQMWSPGVDISEDDKEWTIEIDLPGVSRDNIHVEVHNNLLHIRAEMRQESQDFAPNQQGQPAQQGQQGQQGQWAQGPSRQYHRRERRYGYFERTFPLPENVEEENVRCDFRDGVLTCHLPKSQQAIQQARRIAIGDGTQAAQQGQAQPATQGGKLNAGQGGTQNTNAQPAKGKNAASATKEPAMKA